MNTDIFDIGATPINAQEPAGHDVSYDDDFDALGHEIKKLSSPTAGSSTDWDKVRELCIRILREKSKHLQVACYLCVALCQTDGIGGCAAGIHIIREMMENFWDTLYPPKKRKKGRINALAWWAEKVQASLEGKEPETWDAARRAQLMDDLATIDTIIGDKLPDGPLLRSLMDSVSALIVEEQEDDAKPESDTTQGTEGADRNKPPADPAAPHSEPQQADIDQPSSRAKTSTGTESHEPQPEPVSTFSDETSQSVENPDADADKYFAGGLDFLGQAATKFLKQDIKRPIGYQINRLIAWSGIDALPPATDGKTMLPPPDEQLVTLLKGQYESGLWEVLLVTAESYVRQYLFWLDLSFYVATALDMIHARTASMAVANDTLLFITRMHSLENLCFSNGMPFACEDTRQWLMELANPAGNGTITVTPGSDRIQHTESEAMQMVDKQGIEEALSFFKKDMGAPDSGRERFMHDLAMCRLMLKARQVELALPFADRLVQTVDRMDMDSWEPDLALQALSAAYRIFRQNKGKATVEKTEKLRQRIILIAPEKAANLVTLSIT